MRLKGLGSAMRAATPKITNRPVMINGDRWLWTCPECPSNYWQTSADTYVKALLVARAHLLDPKYHGATTLWGVLP